MIRGSHAVALLTGIAIGALATSEARADDHVELNLIGGVMMPSQFTPEIVYPTFTGVGPFVRIESTVRLARHFELGAYLSLSDHPITSQEPGHSTSKDASGSILLFSAGALAKLRFDPAEWATIRGGLTLGFDYESFGLDGLSPTDKSMKALGLQVGLDADFRARLTESFAIVGELGFSSQPVGSATFPDDNPDYPGKSVSFAFQPVIFLGAGPELMF